jgi:hypothetical protein
MKILEELIPLILRMLFVTIKYGSRMKNIRKI